MLKIKEVKANKPWPGVYHVAALTAIIWVVHTVNLAVGLELNQFGILPRTTMGLVGILASPFLHGNNDHLVFNTVPLFVLGTMVITQGVGRFYAVTWLVILITGVLVWCFGREALHIGASGLIFGYFGYLVANAYYHRSLKAIFMSIAAFILYSSLLMGLLPMENGVSWEAHVAGAFSGILCAWIFGRRSPPSSQSQSDFI